MIFPILPILFCALVAIHAQDTATITLIQPKSCPIRQFFDITLLACRDCPLNAQQNSAKPTECECQPDAKRISSYGGYSLLCEKCPAGEVSNPGGWKCVPCESPATETTTIVNGNGTTVTQNGTTTVASAGTCSKCDNQPSEFLLARTVFGADELQLKCRQCVAKTIAETRFGRTSCIPCNRATDEDDCDCSNGVKTGGVCFSSDADQLLLQTEIPQSAALSIIEYSNGASIDSAYYRQHLRSSYVLCQKGNLTACQLVANLCVLVHYRRTTDTNACGLYEKLRAGPQGAQGNRWQVNNVPILFPADSSAILVRTRLPTSYTTERGHENSVLRLRLAEYSVGGEFLGFIDPAREGTLQLCSRELSLLTTAFTFGTFYTLECELSLRQLWKHEMRMYDAFIEFETGQGDERVTHMYNVYVLNRNYEDRSGELVNERRSSEDRTRWQLTRRFFLVDNRMSVGESQSADTRAQIVRFARFITLRVELQTTKNGHIYPPFLDIEYEDVPYAKINESMETSFATDYKMDSWRHDRDLEITLGVICSVAAVWAIVKAWSWLRRTGKIMLDVAAVGKFLIYTACALADVFFIVMFSTALWIWGAYKIQNTVVYMLLTKDQENYMLICISVAFALKCIEMLHCCVEQMLTETFFIDWERPRGHVIPLNGEDAQAMPSVADANNHPASPITIWRTYMIANEWNELQNYRKTSLPLQLMALLFILQVWGVETWAAATPGLNTLSPSEAEVIRDTRMTRFALATSLYLLLGFVQWAFTAILLEPIGRDQFRNFMDLCSISNISVLALTQSHHGYYIHGRSVHGYSDANMKQMNEMLQRERDNLCGQRGLEASTENQCFVVCLPNAFRERFDSLRKALSAGSASAQHDGVHPATAMMDTVIQVHESVNAYLMAFIEQRIEDINYQIKDRTFIEAVLDVDFDEFASTGTFFRDKSEMAYSNAFVYGNEWTNLSFDCLLFAVVDLYFRNYLLAAIVTYGVVSILRIITQTGFTKNLVRSSLVDKRFLI